MTKCKYFVKKDLTETEQVVLDYSLTSSSSMMKQSWPDSVISRQGICSGNNCIRNFLPWNSKLYQSVKQTISLHFLIWVSCLCRPSESISTKCINWVLFIRIYARYFWASILTSWNIVLNAPWVVSPEHFSVISLIKDNKYTLTYSKSLISYGSQLLSIMPALRCKSRYIKIS